MNTLISIPQIKIEQSKSRIFRNTDNDLKRKNEFFDNEPNKKMKQNQFKT